MYLWAKFRDAGRIRLHLDTQGQLLAGYNPIGFCAPEIHPFYNCWSNTVGHIVHFPGWMGRSIRRKADGLYPQHPRNLTFLREGVHPVAFPDNNCSATMSYLGK